MQRLREYIRSLYIAYYMWFDTCGSWCGDRCVLVPVWALTFAYFKRLETWQEHMDGVKTKVKVDITT